MRTPPKRGARTFRYGRLRETNDPRNVRLGPDDLQPDCRESSKDVAGIEAAIWCETITNFRDLQFLLMPRLAGVAEKVGPK